MESRARRFGRSKVMLLAVVVASSMFAAGLCGVHVSRAAVKMRASEDLARQVTVFGVVAIPGGKGVDAKLLRLKTQLAQLIPNHSFKLLGAQTSRMVAGDSIPCDLGNSYRVETCLVQPLDVNGMIQLRCQLYRDEERLFSTLVKTPANQLFFCQRAFGEDSQLLIGVGAR